MKKTVYMAVDSFTWQMLASVVIPGYTVNRICTFSNMLMKKYNIAKKRRLTIVPIVGLASIPIILKPIDHLTDKILDASLRNIKSM